MRRPGRAARAYRPGPACSGPSRPSRAQRPAGWPDTGPDPARLAGPRSTCTGPGLPGHGSIVRGR
jgi:hypothetical protein